MLRALELATEKECVVLKLVMAGPQGGEMWLFPTILNKAGKCDG